MTPQIGSWVRRRFGAGGSFVTKWHLADSIVAGDVVTRCGRRMADKADAPFQVSDVMPLTRMIGQPQNCRMCDPHGGIRVPTARTTMAEDDPSVAHEPVEA